MTSFYPEITADNLAHEFMRRFQTLNDATRAGIATLMQKLTIRGFANKPVLEAMNAANVWSDEWFLGPQGRDRRVDRLCWIATDWDKFVGNNMTVEQIRESLRESGCHGWPDGR